MKSVFAIVDTIDRKCQENDYGWQPVFISKKDDETVTFDIQDLSNYAIHTSVIVRVLIINGEGYVRFELSDDYSNDCVLTVKDYKCEIGSIYMNDIINMMLKMLSR